MEHLLEVYGYPLLFLGTFLEGETPLLAASFLARQGYFSLPIVMLVAFSATFSSDQLFFYLGRSRGRAFLEKRPKWQPKIEHAQALLDRWGSPLVVGFRFIYGLRIVTPFVVGMAGFGPIRFLFLNVFGGLLWSLVFSVLGYSLGSVLEIFLVDARRYALLVALALLLVPGVVWLVNRRRQAG